MTEAPWKHMAVVAKVSKVEQHPDAPHLDMIYFYNLPGVVSMKLEDGSPRYKEDELVIYITEGSIVPEYLLRQGFWNDEKGIGLLSGPQGNRVKASNFRGVRSHGILFPLTVVENMDVFYDGMELTETLGIT